MKKVLLALLSAAVLVGCDPKNETATPAAPTTGVYVLSEGRFGAGDGAVSAFDKTTKALTVDAFAAANGGAQLGDVVQDMGIVGNKGFVCVNATGKIEVVSLPDFKSVRTLRTPQPRYFAGNSTRGYVTCWRGPYTNYLPGTVLILDVASNTVIDSVKVGRNPERPALLGNQLFVPNSYDNTITVVDVTTKATSTITVAPGPQSVVADASNNLWALCSRPYGSTATPAAALVRFTASSTAAQLTLPFASGGVGALAIDGSRQNLYFRNGSAQYQMATSATTLPTTPLIRRNFNGFAVDPRDNSLFGAVAPSYTNNGYFLHYSATGTTRLDSVTVRVGPNGFAFY